MNIYFSPTERNELNFPTSSLSTTITNAITNSEELEEKNSVNDDNLSKEKIEISQFYEKYRADKQLFKKTESQKKLNKVKVYFIVKSKIIEGKEVQCAVPIRSFEDLGNTIVEKSSAFITSLFYLKKDHNLNGREYIEGSPGARPFRLDEVMDPEPPFFAEEEVPLEKLILPKKYVVNGGKLELANYVFYGGKIKFVEDSEVEVENSDIRYQEEPEELDEAYEDLTYLIGFFPTEYDYYDSMFDDTVLLNSWKYGTDIRQKTSVNVEEEEEGFLFRLNRLNLKENPFKLFNISNIFSLVFGDKDLAMDKNIIPVFSNLEDAQDLLITILDEVHQPFQVRRKIENIDTTHYSRSLSYLDDSFSFQNTYVSPGPRSKLERAQDLLMKCGIIKSSDVSNSSNHEFYNENKYQTKGPCFVEDPYQDTGDVYIPMSQISKRVKKSVWRETADYWSFLRFNCHGEQEAYSWQESRDLNDVDKGLLKKSQDVKIISMGLGDFLEFWNNPTKKNGDVLFIPSSKELSKRKIPLLPKKSRDKFYDYQQKFRESKKQDTENYIYEIKLSAE